MRAGNLVCVHAHARCVLDVLAQFLHLLLYMFGRIIGSEAGAVFPLKQIEKYNEFLECAGRDDQRTFLDNMNDGILPVDG